MGLLLMFLRIRRDHVRIKNSEAPRAESSQFLPRAQQEQINLYFTQHLKGQDHSHGSRSETTRKESDFSVPAESSPKT